MSMEDILKVLVDSRQQGASSQGADPMSSLIGGLLGGSSQGGVNLSDGVDAGDVINLVGGLMGGTGQSQSASQPQTGGLGDMMGALEGIMGGGQGGMQSAGDPVMMLLQPFIEPLAKKANIPPAIAMIVASFVAHKLLAHHPTSGRDSNTFDLEELLGQVNAGGVDASLLQNSGMIKEISKKTGMDEATAGKSLGIAFNLIGQGAAGLANRRSAGPSPKPKVPAGPAAKPGAGKIGATGRAKSVKK